MGWSGGTFTRARDWTDDEAGAVDMLSVNFDQEDDNFEAGINACLTKDGTNAPSADLPMGGNTHTGVGDAANKDDYASAADVIDQHLNFYVDSGAADVYAITPSPSIAAYAEGQRLVFRATNANTGASTLNVNAIGAIAIETNDATALAANMIVVGGYYEVTYDANGSRFVMTSPHSITPASTATSVIAGTGLTGGGTLAADRTLNVIGGDGITANADDIAISATVAGTGMTHSSGVLNVIGGAGLVANADDMAVGGGNGITANANDVALTDAAASTTNPVDISSGTVSLDVEALTTIEGSALAATDTLYVEDGGVSKGIEVQALGLRVQTAQGTQTLAAADMNSIMEFTATSTLTLPVNSGVDLPVGVPIVLNVKHATQVLTVTAAASVTLVSTNHPAGGSAASDTVSAGGSAVLFKTAADVWALSGDIAD